MLLVEGFGKESDITDERKRLYELFLKKKAMSNIREFQPLNVGGFGSEQSETKSKASSRLPADQVSKAPSRVSKAPSKMPSLAAS